MYNTVVKSTSENGDDRDETRIYAPMDTPNGCSPVRIRTLEPFYHHFL